MSAEAMDVWFARVEQTDELFYGWSYQFTERAEMLVGHTLDAASIVTKRSAERMTPKWQRLLA